VFGAARQRRRGDLTFDEALHRAAEFFRPLADVAAAHGCVLCFEPNAAAYGCDFVRTIGEAARLARLVEHAAFRVQLDVGNFMLEHDAIDDVRAAMPLVGHCHASAPMLAPVGAAPTELGPLMAVAREGDYRGHVSIEMLPDKHDAVAAIGRALDYVIATVGSRT
jgi:sugar phosphate isomerase/epimerase